MKTHKKSEVNSPRNDKNPAKGLNILYMQRLVFRSAYWAYKDMKSFQNLLQTTESDIFQKTAGLVLSTLVSECLLEIWYEA